MKKQQNTVQRQALTLSRETLRDLNDDTLKSIAGGCGGMPPSCTCPDVTWA